MYRAIGMRKSDIYKLTLYEAMATLVSSSILGFIIGVISATSMTALFLVMVELPFQLLVRQLYKILMTLIVIIQIYNTDDRDDCNNYSCGYSYRYQDN